MLEIEFRKSVICSKPLRNRFGDLIVKPGQIFYLIQASKIGKEGDGFINLLIEPNYMDNPVDVQIPFVDIERLKTRNQLKNYLFLVMQLAPPASKFLAQFRIGPLVFDIDVIK